MAERDFLDAVEDGPKGDVRIMLLSLGASRNVSVKRLLCASTVDDSVRMRNSMRL